MGSYAKNSFHKVVLAFYYSIVQYAVHDTRRLTPPLVTETGNKNLSMRKLNGTRPLGRSEMVLSLLILSHFATFHFISEVQSQQGCSLFSKLPTSTQNPLNAGTGLDPGAEFGQRRPRRLINCLKIMCMPNFVCQIVGSGDL